MNRIEVLDHGYVELVRVDGNDEFLAQTARTSTESSGDGPKDRGLVRRLVRDRHTSPIEFGNLVFEIKMPIFVARQLMRHRAGTFNEFSMRYTEAPEEYYVPKLERMQAQSTFNKQGSAEMLPEEIAGYCVTEIDRLSAHAYSVYQNLLATKLTRELARCVLPVNFYTKVRWNLNLHNLMHFLKLREDPHAQYEIQVFANAIHKLAKEAFPVAMEAYEDYIENSRTVSPQLLVKLAQMMHRMSELDEDFEQELDSEAKEIMKRYG